MTSRFPLGCLAYASQQPPGASISVITGATTKIRIDPSSGKQKISFARGQSSLLAPLPQTYCFSGARSGRAFAWLTWLGAVFARLVLR